MWRFKTPFCSIIRSRMKKGKQLFSWLETCLKFRNTKVLLRIIPETKPQLMVNNILIQFNLVFLNSAISFIPCFKYEDNMDIILFTSKNFYYHVDNAGQFNENFYGMKFDLMDQLFIEYAYTDLNDHVQFKSSKLTDLTTESKTVLYYPSYKIQLQSKA